MMRAHSYTAVDVETPNRGFDALCSIGIVHADDGIVTFQREYLVNPETVFEPMNIAIHGITPQMVKNAPTFPQVWEEVRAFFESDLLLAHNAVFDLTVIAGTLRRYDLLVPEMRYVCTVELARKHIPKELYGSHRLGDLSRGLNIPLRHHNALSDADACRQVFEHLAENYGLTKHDIKVFR